MTRSRGYQGEFIRVSRYRITQRDGSIAFKDRVEHPDSVVILAHPRPHQVLLIQQYRPVLETTLWELPAGKMLPGETPRSAARRELIEETGYRARSLRRISRFYPAPGILTECLHLYRATDLTAGRTRMDLDEEIETHVISRAEVRRMLASGTITDAKSLVGLMTWAR